MGVGWSGMCRVGKGVRGPVRGVLPCATWGLRRGVG